MIKSDIGITQSKALKEVSKERAETKGEFDYRAKKTEKYSKTYNDSKKDYEEAKKKYNKTDKEIKKMNEHDRMEYEIGKALYVDLGGAVVDGNKKTYIESLDQLNEHRSDLVRLNAEFKKRHEEYYATPLGKLDRTSDEVVSWLKKN